MSSFEEQEILEFREREDFAAGDTREIDMPPNKNSASGVDSDLDQSSEASGEGNDPDTEAEQHSTDPDEGSRT